MNNKLTRRMPSKQQAQALSRLPVQDREFVDQAGNRRINGNLDRTFRSLIDRGWATWDEAPRGWALLRITDADRAALARYKENRARRKAAR